MHEQRVDHPQVDEDDRYRPPRRERDEDEVDHDRKARNEDSQQARPGRSRKDSETGREPDDSTDQVDPSPGSGARRDPIALILEVGRTSDDASEAFHHPEEAADDEQCSGEACSPDSAPADLLTQRTFSFGFQWPTSDKDAASEGRGLPSTRSKRRVRR